MRSSGWPWRRSAAGCLWQQLSTSTKTVVDLNGGEPDPGDTLRYTITLRESAGIAAPGVNVTDDLAAELGQLAVIGMPPGAVDGLLSSLAQLLPS